MADPGSTPNLADIDRHFSDAPEEMATKVAEFLNTMYRCSDGFAAYVAREFIVMAAQRQSHQSSPLGNFGGLGVSDKVAIAEEFRLAMARSGIVTHDSIIADARMQRFDVEGDRVGSKNGWYRLHPTPYPFGVFGSWKLGTREIWNSAIPKNLSREELAELKKHRDEALAAQKAEIERRESKARANAEAIWRDAEPTPAGFPYLLSKKISPNGSRYYKSQLVLPVYDVCGALQSLQFISATGEKRFLPGGRIAGCCYPMGNKIRKTRLHC